jgi:hypothetical protein
MLSISDDVEHLYRTYVSNNLEKNPLDKSYAISYFFFSNCFFYIQIFYLLTVSLSSIFCSYVFLSIFAFDCVYQRFRDSLRPSGEVYDDFMAIFVQLFNSSYLDVIACHMPLKKIILQPFLVVSCFLIFLLNANNNVEMKFSNVIIL